MDKVKIICDNVRRIITDLETVISHPVDWKVVDPAVEVEGCEWIAAISADLTDDELYQFEAGIEDAALASTDMGFVLYNADGFTIESFTDTTTTLNVYAPEGYAHVIDLLAALQEDADRPRLR